MSQAQPIGNPSVPTQTKSGLYYTPEEALMLTEVVMGMMVDRHKAAGGDGVTALAEHPDLATVFYLSCLVPVEQTKEPVLH